MRADGRFWRILAVMSCLVSPAFAGFQSTETYLVAVGRAPGQFGAQIYSTVWATNLTGAPNPFTVYFLKQGQANTSPASFSDTLAPGETKIYENIAESKFGLTSAIGAARIVSAGEILVSERIYNQPSGADLGNTEGFFFAGVPKTFSISSGQSASIQGVNQGGSENFRSNFILVETGGASTTVNVQVFEANGTLLGQKAYPLQAYEQFQANVGDIVSPITTTNGRITATVTGGTGSVLLAGAQVANESQDASGFEMSFRDDILGSGGGTAGVTSLNGLTGALTIAHGANTTVNVNGSTITIDAVSGSGTGLTAVAHDNTLVGSGTVALPLGIAPGAGGGGGVTSLNALTGGLSLTPGSGISVTPSGNSIAIAYTGGGSGGLTEVTHDPSLTGAGTGANPLAIANSQVVRSLTVGASTLHDAVTLANGDNVTLTPSGNTIMIAAKGLTLPFVGADPSSKTTFSITNSSSDTSNTAAIVGIQQATQAAGFLGVGLAGVIGKTTGNGTGVLGLNDQSQNEGHLGDPYYGAYGFTSNGGTAGVFGETGSPSGWGVEGFNPNTGSHGYLGGHEYGVAGIAPTTGSPVYAGDFSGDVLVTGHLKANGVTLAIAPDPIQPESEIGYAFLVGREPGTYFRGTGHVVNGFATIEVPEDFRMVTAEKGLTVVVTPVGGLAVLAAVHKGLDRIVIQGSGDVEFDYMVNGVREGSENFSPTFKNEDFIPRSANDKQFALHLDAQTINTLKANGILNADGTINLDTAHRLGWDQRPGWNEEVKGAER